MVFLIIIMILKLFIQKQATKVTPIFIDRTGLVILLPLKEGKVIILFIVIIAQYKKFISILCKLFIKDILITCFGVHFSDCSLLNTDLKLNRLNVLEACNH